MYHIGKRTVQGVKKVSKKALSYIHEDAKTTYIVENIISVISQHKCNLINAQCFSQIQKLVQQVLTVLSS